MYLGFKGSIAKAQTKSENPPKNPSSRSCFEVNSWSIASPHGGSTVEPRLNGGSLQLAEG